MNSLAGVQQEVVVLFFFGGGGVNILVEPLGEVSPLLLAGSVFCPVNCKTKP